MCSYFVSLHKALTSGHFVFLFLLSISSKKKSVIEGLPYGWYSVQQKDMLYMRQELFQFELRLKIIHIEQVNSARKME